VANDKHDACNQDDVMSIKKNLLVGFLITVAAIALLVTLALTHRTTFNEYPDPSGEYTVRISYRTYYSFIPMMPGSSSDKPAYVKITRNKDGENMGEIPVPMLQLAGLTWHAQGAEVQLIGVWDFANERCYYWNEAQDKKIYVKGSEPNPE
jgi:hypothetical protein